MAKKIDGAERDKKIDEILEKHRKLDDICREIFFTLHAYKRLRFNELHRRLKIFGTDISKPALIDHLKHLRELKLVSRKHEDFQNVSYGLTDEIISVLGLSEEETRERIERFLDDTVMPEEFRGIPFDEKEYYRRLSAKELDEEVIKDLDGVITQNLFELKSFINYDLKLEKTQSDAEFWGLVGNPLYRMVEKRIVENCRESEIYRNMLFEKIDFLIDALRPDRELFREREERGKRGSKK
jgi:DNA-binding transcriptional ArsR family regulator